MSFKLKLKKLILDLNYTWKISRESSDVKTNFCVELTRDGKTGLGEAAPSIRFQETPELVEEQFEQIKVQLENVEEDQFIGFLDQATIGNCLKNALACAFFDWQRQSKGQSLFQQFKLDENVKAATAISLPIMAPEDLENFLAGKNWQRFDSLKVKIDASNNPDMVNKLVELGFKKIKLDANEAFKHVDDFLRFMDKIDQSKIDMVEQPFPCSHENEHRQLKGKIEPPVIADESSLFPFKWDKIQENFDGLSFKMMQIGGPHRVIEGIRLAKEIGLKTMVGCRVETSLGLREALAFSQLVDFVDLDGFLIIKDEPFKLIEESQGRLTFRN